MTQLITDLQESGLSLDQIKRTLTIISNWTNEKYPVAGTLFENILRENQLIEYPLKKDQ